MAAAVPPPFFDGSMDPGDRNCFPQLVKLLASVTMESLVEFSRRFFPGFGKTPENDDGCQTHQLAWRLRRSVFLWALGVRQFPELADDADPDLLEVVREVAKQQPILREAITGMDCPPVAWLGTKVFAETLVSLLGPIRTSGNKTVRPCGDVVIKEDSGRAINLAPLALGMSATVDRILGMGKRLGKAAVLKASQVEIIIFANEHWFLAQDGEPIASILAAWTSFVTVVQRWRLLMVPASLPCRIIFKVAWLPASRLASDGFRLGHGFTLKQRP
jgi:hypothetical protein